MSKSGGDGGQNGGAGRLLLKDYAERYGADVRTVKRWRAHGVKRDDELPLADPEAMMGWWQRNMKLRVPAGITEAVVEWRKAGKSPAAPLELLEDLPVKAKAPAADVERKAEIDRPVDEQEMGIEQTLRRLMETEVRLSRIATDPGQTKAWLDTIARMSSAAEKLRLENERMGKLLPRDRAEVMIHEFHVPIEREIRLMVRTMCDLLGMPETPAVEAMWNKECDRVFARLGEEVFR